MKIRPEELTTDGYVLLDELEHNGLAPFIMNYIKKRTKYSVLYFLINFIFAGLIGYFFIQGYNLSDYHFGARFTYFSYGAAIAFLLIPLHEYIHVLAYKSQGAKHTSYAANLKKFHFMALADKFVANKKEFKIVALAPFAAISITLLILLFYANANWKLTISSVLFVHAAMCSGDFGLLNYFEFHRDKEVVTYDDVEHKVSYFYGQTSESKITTDQH